MDQRVNNLLVHLGYRTKAVLVLARITPVLIMHAARPKEQKTSH